tara:strand:- start:865 stop:1587 length:723 start_codon:yes stop_codon:yes gene_type:complete
MKIFGQKGKLNGHDISLFQNFICTRPERLESLKTFLPAWAEVLNPFPVVVNYDTEIYADEVYTLYDTYFENLYFQQDLGREFTEPIKDFFTITDSPYIMYICEDYAFTPELTRDRLLEIFDEYKHFDCRHLMVTRPHKYLAEHWHTDKHYLSGKPRQPSMKGKNLWVFHSSQSPYWQFAAAGLFERNLYKTVVEECIGKGKGINGIDKIEQSGLIQRDVMCCCLTDPLIKHVHPTGTGER